MRLPSSQRWLLQSRVARPSFFSQARLFVAFKARCRPPPVRSPLPQCLPQVFSVVFTSLSEGGLTPP